MSGTKIVSLLNENNDVFISGGPITKFFCHPSEDHSSRGQEEMVLCAKASLATLDTNNAHGAAGTSSDKLGSTSSGTSNGALTSQTSIALSSAVNRDMQAVLSAEDPEQALKEAEEKSKAAAKERNKAPPKSELLWRIPYSHVLRVSPMKEFYSTIARDPDLPEPEWTSTSLLTQAIRPEERKKQEEIEKAKEKKAANGTVITPLPEYGFVVELIDNNHKHPRYCHPSFSFHTNRTCEVAPLKCENLRYRFFSCASQVEEMEWIQMWTAVTTNFWHEKLESTIIHDPHVYQFHTWAINKSNGLLTQLVLSTNLLYAVPRQNLAQEVGSCPSVNVGALTKIKLETLVAPDGAGVVICKMKSGNGGGVTALPDQGYAFFTGARAFEFVLELQRIWEMLKGEHEEFPFETPK